MFLVIRQERMRRGWTQEHVARAIGITKGAFRNIETGQRKPSYDVLVKLLDLFDYTDPRELFAAAAAPTNPSISRGRQPGKTDPDKSKRKKGGDPT